MVLVMTVHLERDGAEEERRMKQSMDRKEEATEMSLHISDC